MRPTKLALWFLLPVALAAQPCSEAKQQTYVPFSTDYDVAALEVATEFDTIPRLSTGFVPLDEASGAVHCTWAPHAVWVVEDGGAGPMLYLINVRNGRVMSRLHLNNGWTNEDWEDLAHWTDPSGQHWLGIGEVGDNEGVRPTRRIYALTEPQDIDTIGSAIQYYRPTATKVWNFAYEDGPRDVESMFSDPVDGRIYLVTKRDMRNRLYVLPSEPLATVDTARFLGDLPIYMTTAADRLLLPSGRSPVVVRSYGRIYYWDAAPNEAACEVLQRIPTQLPYTEQEPQGEIFAWLRDGTYVLLSEKVAGIRPQVHRYERN